MIQNEASISGVKLISSFFCYFFILFYSKEMFRYRPTQVLNVTKTVFSTKQNVDAVTCKKILTTEKERKDKNREETFDPCF